MACCRSLPICADTAGILMRWVLVSSLACHPKLAHVSHERRVAERGGFEPPCPLRDKTLSRRPRYDHFGTSPGRWANPNFTVIGSQSKTSAAGRVTDVGRPRPRQLHVVDRLPQTSQHLPQT